MNTQFDQIDEKAIVALNTEEVDAVSGGLCCGGLLFLGGLTSIIGGLCATVAVNPCKPPVTVNPCRPRPTC